MIRKVEYVLLTISLLCVLATTTNINAEVTNPKQNEIEILNGPQYLFASAKFWTMIKYRVRNAADESDLTVSDIALQAPKLKWSGTLAEVNCTQYLTRKVSTQVQYGVNWTVFETYINPTCYDGLELTLKGFYTGATIELTVLSSPVVSDKWDIDVFVDENTPAVDQTPTSSWQVLPKAFFAVPSTKTWRLLREGSEMPWQYGSTVNQVQYYYPFEYVSSHGFSWDHDVHNEPDYELYEYFSSTESYSLIGGAPGSFFHSDSDMTSSFTNSPEEMVVETKVTQTGDDRDFGEFVASNDSAQIGYRFGISYGGTDEITIDGTTFIAMDYSKTEPLLTASDGFEFDAVLSETQPKNGNGTIGLTGFVFGNAVTFGLLAVPASWPAWAGTAITFVTGSIWQGVTANVNPDSDTSGKAFAKTSAYRLFGSLEDLQETDSNVLKCVTFTPTDDFSHHGNTNEDIDLDFDFSSLQVKAGSIIGVSATPYVRVQLQSKDTNLLLPGDVEGKAEVKYFNFEWKQGNGDTQQVGAITVKCRADPGN